MAPKNVLKLKFSLFILFPTKRWRLDGVILGIKDFGSLIVTGVTDNQGAGYFKSVSQSTDKYFEEVSKLNFKERIDYFVERKKLVIIFSKYQN